MWDQKAQTFLEYCEIEFNAKVPSMTRGNRWTGS